MLLAATFASAFAATSPGHVRIPIIRSSRYAHDHGSVDASSNRSSPIPIYTDTDYDNLFIPIKVGTPKPGKHLPEINVLLSTMSSNLWIPSANCSTCLEVQSRHVYDHNSSSSYAPNGTHFQVNYTRMDGSVEGYLSYDAFHMGDVKVDKLEFAEVTDASKMPLYRKTETYDGILGLGFNALAVDGVPTVMSRLIKDGAIDKPVLGISLNADMAKTGELMVGDIDRDAFIGDLEVVSVDTSGYWQVTSNEIWIGGGADERQKPELIAANQAVAFSTEAAYLSLPKKHFDLLVARIGAEFDVDLEIYGVQCNTVFALKIIIDNKPIILTQMELTSVFVGPMCQLLVSEYEDKSGEDIWQLGHNFLRKYYTVFDYGTRKVGFAESSRKSAPTTVAASTKKLLRGSDVNNAQFDTALPSLEDIFTAATPEEKENPKESIILF